MEHTCSTEETTGESWIKLAAKTGYAAKGVVYLIIGGLATVAAFGTGGGTTGSDGALVRIVNQPVGRILLGIVAAGLVGYTAWRLILCFLDPENKGTDVKGLVMRGYYFVSAVIHGSLVYSAYQLIMGSGGSGGGGAESKTAELMSQPFGQWLVGIVGATIIASAFFQFYRAYEKKFCDRMAYDEVDLDARRWLIRLGQSGLSARGTVFLVIGGFLILAAVQADPEDAKGLGQALSTLESQPYGPWILGIVGLGLICYAAHQFVKVRYRRIG